jgi:outer membrane protein assembly factor BamB
MSIFYFIKASLLLSVFCIGCNPLEIGVEPNEITDNNPLRPEKDTLQIKWQVPINYPYFGDELTFSIKPFVFDNKLIYSSEAIGREEQLNCINLKTKEHIWDWSGYNYSFDGERKNKIGSYGWVDEKVIDDNILWFTNKKAYLINLLSGNDEYTYELDPSSTFKSGSVQLGLIIFSVKSKIESYVLLCDKALQCKKIYVQAHDENREYGFGHPRMELDQTTGDTLVYFYLSSISFEGARSSTTAEAIAFNYSEGSETWRYTVKEDIMNRPVTHFVNYPQLNDQFLFFQLQTHILCLDKQSGKLIWTYDLGSGLGSSLKIILEGDKLYFGTSIGDIYCLDLYTGRRIWFNDKDDETGGVADDGFLYKGLLFFTDLYSLVVIDKASGKGVGKYYTPNKKRFPVAGIISANIDESTNTLYAYDGYYIMACEIPGQ